MVRIAPSHLSTCTMFTHNRNGISLNGTWKFCPDPMQRCRRQKWWKNPSKPNAIFPCWDVSGLWDIQVPGTWKKQFPGLEWYDGHAVYYRTFDLDELPAGAEAFLVFDGIVYASEVYLNGQKMGGQDWGYSTYSLRVTEVLQKKNEIFVLVDNTLSTRRVPGEIFDWNNDGGIINGVKLVVVPGAYVENFQVTTRLTEEQVEIEVGVDLQCRDLSRREDVLVEVPELGLAESLSVQAGKRGTVKFTLSEDRVALWCPENPKLYVVKISTALETVEDEIGFREIRTEGQDILLNGKAIRLYGVCVHSELPETGRTLTAEGIDRIIAAAKELGLNFLRCAHYPYAEIFGRAMDKAGLLWWQEVPAYWLFPMREEAMSRLACGMLENTIRRDWNRGSLIIWSISNECCWRNPEDPEEHNYVYWWKAAKVVRELDPTRLLSSAESGNIISTSAAWSPTRGDQFVGVGEAATNHRPMHSDEFYQLFDILSANLYVDGPGEAGALYERFVRLFDRYNKPLMLSEFGSMSLRGSDVPEDQLGSEVRHARMIEEAYETFYNLPQLKGYSPWVLTDGRAPIHWRWYNEGTGLYRYGFLDEKWQPKKAHTSLKESIRRLQEHWSQAE